MLQYLGELQQQVAPDDDRFLFRFEAFVDNCHNNGTPNNTISEGGKLVSTKPFNTYTRKRSKQEAARG